MVCHSLAEDTHNTHYLKLITNSIKCLRCLYQRQRVSVQIGMEQVRFHNLFVANEHVMLGFSDSLQLFGLGILGDLED